MRAKQRKAEYALHDANDDAQAVETVDEFN